MRFWRFEGAIVLVALTGAAGCPGRGTMTTPDEPAQSQPAPSARSHHGTGLPPGIAEPQGAPTDDVQPPPERRPAELPN